MTTTIAPPRPPEHEDLQAFRAQALTIANALRPVG
jgi:hypothetical protein